MDSNEMEKIEIELREYGGGGPSPSRKTSLKAANLIKELRFYLYGKQETLDVHRPD